MRGVAVTLTVWALKAGLVVCAGLGGLVWLWRWDRQRCHCGKGHA